MGFNEEKCGVLPPGRDSPGHQDVQAAFEPVTRTLYSASVSSNGKGKAPSRGHRFSEHQSEAPALNNSCSLFLQHLDTSAAFSAAGSLAADSENCTLAAGYCFKWVLSLQR